MDDRLEHTLSELRESASHAAETLNKLSGEDDWIYRYVHFDTKSGEFIEDMCLAPNMDAVKQFADSVRLLNDTARRLYGDGGGEKEESGLILIPQTKGEENDFAENEGDRENARI